jgi:uncharacterized protein YeaO (DUF488 family)
MVKLRRAYETPLDHEGKRYLVERLWPRGVKKETLRLDGWLKKIAPSPALHKWYAHDPERWEEFKAQYQQELNEPEKEQVLQDLAREAREGTITFIFATRDRERNNAVILKELIDCMAGGNLTIQRPKPCLSEYLDSRPES